MEEIALGLIFGVLLTIGCILNNIDNVLHEIRNKIGGDDGSQT